MKNIVIYDKSEKRLQCENEKNIPVFCMNCMKRENKACQKFYKDIFEKRKIGLYTCPYGFGSYYIRNTLYTCLIIKNLNYGKLKKSIEYHDQKISEFQNYSEEQIVNYISDMEEVICENILLRDCMHDLRNIGGYFYAMAERIELKYRDFLESDDDLRALISLYELVNYRLNILDGVKIQDNMRIKQKIYPLIRKLNIMLSYQAKKKDIKIKMEYEQENVLYLSNNIYLAMFILLENAIKHAKFGSDINISFKEDTNQTMVSIWNIGPKIEADEISKLTERGYRGKNAISKGTGIGLSLAKEIFESHDYKFLIKPVDLNDDETVFNVEIVFDKVVK